MKGRLLIITVLQLLLISGNSHASMSCYKNMAVLLRNVQASPKNITLNLDRPLNYDLKEFEDWVINFKEGFEESISHNNKDFSNHINRHRNMNVNERKVLSFTVDVRPLSGDNNIYVALFWSQENMNRAQMRTRFYNIGGDGATAGIIPSESSKDLHRACETCQGLTLKGEHYKKFWDEIVRDYYNDVYPEENAFYKNIIAQLMEKHPQGNFQIVSVSAQNASPDTLVHYSHLALFDSNTKYRETLVNYWNEHIKDIDDKNINNQFPRQFRLESLMQRHFFAYLFQPKVFGQTNIMESFKASHLEGAVKALEKEGFSIPFN